MQSSYNFWLVVLSLVLAVGASFVALTIASRIPHIEKRSVWLWLVGGAISMGLAIWSMHFVGMLAFHLDIPLAYDIPLTLYSILFAIGATAIALLVVRRGMHTSLGLLLATLFMGTGIAAMHYTGMYALKMYPAIAYDPILLTLSLLIAYGASFVAMRLFFVAADDRKNYFRLLHKPRAYASILMGIAIAGMHYTGMEAAIFAPGSVCGAIGNGIPAGMMSILIVIGVIVILIFTVLVLMLDIKLAGKDRQLLDKLKNYNRELEEKALLLSEKITKEAKKSARKDEMLATVVEQSADAIVTTDTEGNVSSWNEAATAIFGYPQEDITGKPLAILFPQTPDKPGQFCHILGDQGNNSTKGYCEGLTRDGQQITVSFSKSILTDKKNQHIGEILILRDVTDQQKSELTLRLFASVFEYAGEGIVITDSDNKIISVNRAYTNITGYQSDDVLGQDPGVFASGKQDREFYADMWDKLNATGFWQGEIWNKRKDGEIYPQLLNISIVKNDHDEVVNYIGIFTDIKSQKEQEKQIRYLADHDVLTGLPNRGLLTDRLHQAILNANRHGYKMATIFIDLDYFKNINDTLGHEIGDKLLKEVAQRLLGQIRDVDTVCRFGGDEFLILLTEIKKIDHVVTIVEKMQQTLGQSYLIDENNLMVASSIGISIYPDDGDNPTQLIRAADTAMYHAKSLGRGNFQFFTDELNKAISQRLKLEHALREAIELRQFWLNYQPQIDMATRQVVGVESLIRWQHPEMGFVGPDKFIPVAEETGLIHEVGLWVLEEACKTCDEWRTKFKTVIRIAVNISVKQLNHPDFLSHVKYMVEKYRLEPDMIELEITESVLMDSINYSKSVLDELHDFGIPLAIDDFGTGYSSLSYLRSLSIDTLKIDRSFIADLPEDKENCEIANAIVAMAHGLGLNVIAEGVETTEQIQYLQSINCDEVQGYYFSKPLPKTEIEAYLVDVMS